jgi:hypothetical protein
MTEITKDTEGELARLADGSSTGAERERVLARVESSEELRTALAEQRSAVQMLSAVDAQAPVHLRAELERMLASAPTPAVPVRRVHLSTRLMAAGALAVVIAVAVAVVVSSLGGSNALTVQRAAAFTLERATMPAPAESSSDHSRLAVAVGNVSFPYWREHLGWRASGVRSDRSGGRSITTVFYTSSHGLRVGYAIASGRAPGNPGGTSVRRWGVTYHVLSHDGASVVTWERDGHLCVVSGRDVSSKTLLRLASWEDATRS